MSWNIRRAGDREKNEIMSFAATWKDLEIIILCDVSQTKTNIIWYSLYVDAKKRYKGAYLQNGNRVTDIENKLMATGGKGRRINWEVEMDIYTMIYKMDFPGGASGKELACQCRKHKRWRFNAWVRKIPWRRAWQPTLFFLPAESMDRGAFRATDHWATQRWTWLK